MKSKKLLLLIKSIVLVAILILIFESVGYLLQDTSRIYPRINDRDKIDVAFIGSSHVYCNIIPQKIFDDYGYTCWNFAPPEPGIENTYYALKEINETVHPKVVFIDLLMMGFDTTAEEEFNFQTNLAHEMSSFSKNHYDAANAGHKNYNISREYYYNILRCHTNYNQLTRQLFSNWMGVDVKYSQLGYRSRNGNAVREFEADVYYNEGDTYSEDFVPDKLNVEYLNKIVDYAKENDVQLVFLNSPDLRKAALYDSFLYTDEMLENLGMTVYDFNTVKYREFMDFDYTTDMADGHHLNDKGALKYTEAIEKILTENYDLEDHRNEEGYDTWTKHQYNYVSRMDAATLHSINDLNEYYTVASKLDNQYIVITCSIEGSNLLNSIGIAGGTTTIQCGSTHYSDSELWVNINDYVVHSSALDQTIITVDNVSLSNQNYTSVIWVWDSVAGKTIDKIYIKEDGTITRK